MLTLLVLLGLLSCAAHPVHIPSTRPLQIGVAYGNTLIGMDDDELADALDDAVSLGAGVVRTDLAWYDIQPRSADDYDWTRFDRVVDEARNRDLKLLLVLAYTPQWARPPGCDSSMCAPADPDRFADFARSAAARYAPQGVLAWEIWNEPNTPGFWAPEVDPDGYTVLLRSASAAIRQVDPSALILLGGLASVDTRPGGGMAPQEFLSRVCELGGNEAISAIAYHPYTYPYLASESRAGPSPWSRIDADRNSLRDVAARHGSSDLPVWLTEYGAPTDGPGQASDGTASGTSDQTTHVTVQRQAEIARDVLRTVAADPAIGALIWYSDRDLGDDTETNLNFYGLRRSDGTKKPAFNAFRSAVTQLGLAAR